MAGKVLSTQPFNPLRPRKNSRQIFRTFLDSYSCKNDESCDLIINLCSYLMYTVSFQLTREISFITKDGATWLSLSATAPRTKQTRMLCIQRRTSLTIYSNSQWCPVATCCVIIFWCSESRLSWQLACWTWLTSPLPQDIIVSWT